MRGLQAVLRQKKLRSGVLQALPFWIASLVAGLVAVCYTKLFELAEKWGKLIYHAHPAVIFLMTPVCFLLAWLVVKRVAVYAKGSGIPQVMAAIELTSGKDDHQVRQLLNLRMLLVKVASSLLMVFGGGAIGREGPTIQIAGTVFRKINEWLPASWPKISSRNMILTGAAAGLAAAFNTPLGGIVFAVEELSRIHFSQFKTAVFTSVIIAGLTAQAFLGPYLYLGFPVISGAPAAMILIVVPVAMIGGLGGSAMGLVILKVIYWKDRLKERYSEPLFVLICALLLCSVAYFIGDAILWSGKSQMAGLLFTGNKRLGWQEPVLRIFGPVLSFTTGASGGIFAPSLSAGATVGAFFAGLFDLSASNTNLLILTGMVAFLTGITRSPFTSAILVLEMTDRHNVIFFLMLAGVVSSLISTVVSKHSMYEYLKVQYIQHLERDASLVKSGPSPNEQPDAPR